MTPPRGTVVLGVLANDAPSTRPTGQTFFALDRPPAARVSSGSLRLKVRRCAGTQPGVPAEGSGPPSRVGVAWPPRGERGRSPWTTGRA